MKCSSFVITSYFSPASSDVSFDQLLNKYGFNENVSSSFKCYFLGHVLSFDSAIQQIERNNNTSHLINVWITSVIQEPIKSQAIMEFSTSMLNVGHYSKYISNKECSKSEHIESNLVQFIIGLGKKYSSLATVTEMVEFRKKVNIYFGTIVNASKAYVVSGSSESSLKLIFNICGRLVRHCARCIYLKVECFLLRFSQLSVSK